MSCSCKIGGGPDGVCPECRSREMFHARLRKLEDKAANDRAQGVAEERARIVAWLRARLMAGLWPSTRMSFAKILECIERGEHEEVK